MRHVVASDAVIFDTPWPALLQRPLSPADSTPIHAPVDVRKFLVMRDAPCMTQRLLTCAETPCLTHPV